MDKFYAFYTWKNDTGSGGVKIFYNTPQEIADYLVVNLTNLIEDELLDDDQLLETIKSFIEKTKKKQITYKDISEYYFDVDFGSEMISVIGSDTETIVDIATELFQIMNWRSLDEALKDPDFKEENPEASLEKREYLSYQLYKIGKNGKYPDKKLIEKIEDEYTV